MTAGTKTEYYKPEYETDFGPVAQWIEQQPSKLRVVGSNPSRITTTKEFGAILLEVVSQNKKDTLAGVAQLVERVICNLQVVGSNPASGSTG